MLIILTFFFVSCDKKEATLYRLETTLGWEWNIKGDKNNNPQYIGEVKREYIIFGDYIIDGYGILTVPRGEKYEGEFKNGKYHGFGTETIPNGNKYEGEWKDGKFNGKGKYSFSKGGNFVGLWKDSAPWNTSGYNEKGDFINYVDGEKIKK